jgi:S-adenosylmethionine:tRNA ribosyltransferase-isomerase
MRVDAFDFDLPTDRIALRPADPRDSARLLQVGPNGSMSDHTVSQLPDLLLPGDVLVLNDTRVIAARLEGVRVREGGSRARVGLTLHMREAADRWRAFAQGAKKLKAGDRLLLGGSGGVCLAGVLDATVTELPGGGEVGLRFDLSGPSLDEAIASAGHMPLPPYIASRRADDERDRSDYQTVFAREEGAVAAPTAGLHFTPQLLSRLADRGIGVCYVTLHVGAGTFMPVRTEATEDHRMHAETGSISRETAEALNAARAAGGRITCVGTTSVRVVESCIGDNGQLNAWSGDTDIFITPGYRFRAVDLLVTNFHLPRSTLFMLVSAFSGLETMRKAYAHAVENGYRFYSYGDACLLHPGR